MGIIHHKSAFVHERKASTLAHQHIMKLVGDNDEIKGNGNCNTQK